MCVCVCVEQEKQWKAIYFFRSGPGFMPVQEASAFRNSAKWFAAPITAPPVRQHIASWFLSLSLCLKLVRSCPLEGSTRLGPVIRTGYFFFRWFFYSRARTPAPFSSSYWPGSLLARWCFVIYIFINSLASRVADKSTFLSCCWCGFDALPG